MERLALLWREQYKVWQGLQSEGPVLDDLHG